MHRAKNIASIFAIAILAAAPSFGFTLEPMSALLSPSGAGSVGTFRIKNDGSERIAIKISVLARSQDPEGKEVNSPAADLFAVYPARLLVEPGASSAFKVQWRGPAAIKEERSFRLVAEQIAINASPQAGSGIRVMFRYIASLYVGLGGFAADLAATATEATGSGGESGILVEIENRGNRHIIAINLRLELSDSSGGLISLSGAELGSLNGSNYLPGARRKLFIKRDESPGGKTYDARIAYEGEY